MHPFKIIENLAHEKKIIFTQNTKKKKFAPRLKERIFCLTKNFLSYQNILYLHFLYLSFHFRCFLNMPLLYFILANISRSLFVERFYFFTFYIFFSNWLVCFLTSFLGFFFVTILLLFVFLFFRKILITFTSSFFFQACPCWYLL